MKSAAGKQQSIDELAPLLVEVQRNLSGEIDLASLARRFGYSPFHFHRLFSRVVGETPKKYVQRLRLEKAAYKLAITDETVLNVGLAVGFKNHETFTRAFKRHFGRSPNTVRAKGREIRAERGANPRAFRSDECSISAARFESLRSLILLSIRRLGDYAAIPDPFTESDQLWSKLIDFAVSRGVSYNRVPLAFFHDNPFMTPKQSQRCDACIPIDRMVAGTQKIRCSEFPGGMYGVIEHFGPASTLAQAFRTLASEIWASKKYALKDGPPMTIVRSVEVSGDSTVNHTDVYLPVERK